MSKIDYIYFVLSRATLMTCVTIIYIIFILSTLNGLIVGEYEVILRTNTYNEHWIEVIILSLSFPALISIIKDIFKESAKQFKKII